MPTIGNMEYAPIDITFNLTSKMIYTTVATTLATGMVNSDKRVSINKLVAFPGLLWQPSQQV